jgi:hypothetical protein
LRATARDGAKSLTEEEVKLGRRCTFRGSNRIIALSPAKNLALERAGWIHWNNRNELKLFLGNRERDRSHI